MRVDEFSMHELRERVMLQFRSLLHRYKNCKKGDFLNDSRESQDLESICSAKITRVPSQPEVFPNLRSML